MPQSISKVYGPLGDHLAVLAANGEVRITLPLTILETAILNRPLPATARHPRGHRQWWRGNGISYPHAWHGWQRVGWQVDAVDLKPETVTFSRINGSGSER
jgi:hypothetical protein